MNRLPLFILAFFGAGILCGNLFTKKNNKNVVYQEEDKKPEELIREMKIGKKIINLSKIKKPIVLHFCVSWSFYCKERYPMASKLIQEKNINFYYIDLTEKNEYKTKNYKEFKKEFPYESYTDHSYELSNLFKVQDIPYSLIIEKIDNSIQISITDIKELRSGE